MLAVVVASEAFGSVLALELAVEGGIQEDRLLHKEIECFGALR